MRANAEQRLERLLAQVAVDEDDALALGGQRQREVRGNGRFALAGDGARDENDLCAVLRGDTLQLQAEVAHGLGEVGAGARMRQQKRGSLAAGALSAAHGGDGGEAGQTDEAVQVLGRVNGAARQGEQRHKDEAEDQPDDAAADAGLQSRVGVDGRSGRLDRLVNDLDLRVAQNGGRRSGVDLDGGQQRVIDGLRIAARCRQREQGGIRHRAGRQADGSTLIAQLLLEQQLHAIALQDIGERG